MPAPPSTWYPGPLSPQQLNSDLYSFNGTGYGANGILFHSHKPLMHEQMTASKSLTVSAGGTWNVFEGTNTVAFNMVDTGALFGLGAEYPGPFAVYHFVPQAVAASGITQQPGNTAPQGSTVTASPQGAGGAYLVTHFATAIPATSTPAACGSGLYVTPGIAQQFQVQGGMQAHSTQNAGSSYYLDVINAGGAAYGVLQTGIAYQQVAQMYLPQGNGYTVNWAVRLSAGSATTADVNNFALTLGGATIATSTNTTALTTTVQTPVTGVNSTGQFLGITVGTSAPTSGVFYTGSLYGPTLPSIGNAYTWQPAGFYADATATTETAPCNSVDTAGFTPRHTWVWQSVTQQGIMVAANQNPYTVNGNLTGWVNLGHVTVTAVTPPGAPPPQPSGVLLVADGAASAVRTYTGTFNCTAATQYQMSADFFVSATYNVQLGFDWYDNTGTFLSSNSIAVLPSVTAGQWTPVAFWATAPTNAVSGRPWAGPNSNGGGNIPTSLNTWIAGIAVPAAVPPSPQASWAGAVTSGLMNGISGPKQALALLNNPPTLRCAQGLTTSIGNASATPVTFSSDPSFAPGLDTYNAYNTSTGVYTIPVNGLYLAFDTFPFTNNSTGLRYAGFQVVSAGVTTNYQGPAYQAVSAANATSACGMRVLDLQANDTVAPLAFQSSGGALALSNQAPGLLSRFGLAYLCPYSTGGVQGFTPPQTAFHWFAGVPASVFPGFLNQHLGNDLNFLINRPYFTGYQSVAQTGFVNGTWNAVTIDQVKGLLHGNVGDSYGGWSTSLNAYVAQQQGWYLVFSEVYASIPNLGTGYVAAGIKCSSSGGIVPTTSPDQYQTVFFPTTTGTVYPGAAAVGVYYLNAGEYVQPMIKGIGWNSGTWGTAVAASPSVNSQFTVLWVAE